MQCQLQTCFFCFREWLQKILTMSCLENRNTTLFYSLFDKISIITIIKKSSNIQTLHSNTVTFKLFHFSHYFSVGCSKSNKPVPYGLDQWIKLLVFAQMMPDFQANCLDFDTFDTTTPRAISLQLGDSCPQTFLLS